MSGSGVGWSGIGSGLEGCGYDWGSDIQEVTNLVIGVNLNTMGQAKSFGSFGVCVQFVLKMLPVLFDDLIEKQSAVSGEFCMFGREKPLDSSR